MLIGGSRLRRRLGSVHSAPDRGGLRLLRGLSVDTPPVSQAGLRRWHPRPQPAGPAVRGVRASDAGAAAAAGHLRALPSLQWDGQHVRPVVAPVTASCRACDGASRTRGLWLCCLTTHSPRAVSWSGWPGHRPCETASDRDTKEAPSTARQPGRQALRHLGLRRRCSDRGRIACRQDQEDLPTLSPQGPRNPGLQRTQRCAWPFLS